jgi:hypothetical protein
MSFLPGEEVSRYIENNSPPPAVVARIYEQIYFFLAQNLHILKRIPSPGNTLNLSYFKKIEDRLDLCRRTAPRTFDSNFLSSERISINGQSYLNLLSIVNRFHENHNFNLVLEPRFHSLVMGDTNTENIKISNTTPLKVAQHLIESGAPEEEIKTALANISSDSIGIRFLDPRAIGFKSEGGNTLDDAMYDNKPWHNSLGHYDEIHYEHFSLQVCSAKDKAPEVTLAFNDQNPFQKSYRVKDLAERGKTVNHTATPQGMEDYFGKVMTSVFSLDDPKSPYLHDDPYWLIRFVFVMGTHFAAMPPFHFQRELDGTLDDTWQTQRRPIAIYCEGVKWMNWALDMLEGRRTEFLGVQVPALPYELPLPASTLVSQELHANTLSGPKTTTV